MMRLTVDESNVFTDWIENLRDQRARRRIAQRIFRLESGLFGDVKAVGGGIVEMRIDYGPGYRVYFTQKESRIILLLCGGDKRTQERDIERAKRMIAELEK